MKNWFTSLNGTITLSVAALLTFLRRAFLDWRYEYPDQDPAGNWDTSTALIYMVLIGGWRWGLLAADRGSRRGPRLTIFTVQKIAKGEKSCSQKFSNGSGLRWAA